MKRKNLVISTLVVVAIIVVSKMLILSDRKATEHVTDKIMAQIYVPDEVLTAFGDTSAIFTMKDFTPMIKTMVRSSLEQKDRLLFKSVWLDIGYGQEPLHVGYNVGGTIIYTDEFERHLRKHLTY